jgi:hypothetical protein
MTSRSSLSQGILTVCDDSEPVRLDHPYRYRALNESIYTLSLLVIEADTR